MHDLMKNREKYQICRVQSLITSILKSLALSCVIYSQIALFYALNHSVLNSVIHVLNRVISVLNHNISALYRIISVSNTK